MSDRPPGKIVTFYSYKGGTGRTMALANTAWILAGTGMRVLVIDWDLEAPGLHRYLHPFLEDKELSATQGLIDYFADVEIASRSSGGASPWWHGWSSLTRYTLSLEWQFDGDGLLDFVPAGQQGASYAERVSAFDWRKFYDVLGGGVLLESLKKQLRADYDYILIDSRTGISDTSGICTVQMPDDLVVCFTLNQQSMKGAAAATESAWTQRLKPSGEPGLRVWPVPTRIELAEKERLDASRETARTMFDRYVRHLSRTERASYWARAEVLYQPFFAYEEVLAPFAERRQQTGSMLGSIIALASAITGTEIRPAVISEKVRHEVYDRFVPPRSGRSPSGARSVYLSYPLSHQREAYEFANTLRASNISVFSDERLKLGDDIYAVMRAGMEASAVVLVLVAMAMPVDGGLGHGQREELEWTQQLSKRVIPVIIGGAEFGSLPRELKKYRGIDIRSDMDSGLRTLISALQQIVGENEIAVDPDDPQRGQWGGSSEVQGRRITASVESVSGDWFQITLRVERVAGAPLERDVEFHLHPTFKPSVIRRPVHHGRAELVLHGWGAFTVGATCDDGATSLELDLARIGTLPEKFRER
jgi:hypothetical protein